MAGSFLNNLCNPVKIYLAISVIFSCLSLYMSYSTLGLIWDIMSIAFWAWILQLLCNSGYNTLAMVLAVLPSIFSLFALLVILGAIFSGVLKTSTSTPSPTSYGSPPPSWLLAMFPSLNTKTPTPAATLAATPAVTTSVAIPSVTTSVTGK